MTISMASVPAPGAQAEASVSVGRGWEYAELAAIYAQRRIAHQERATGLLLTSV